MERVAQIRQLIAALPPVERAELLAALSTDWWTTEQVMEYTGKTYSGVKHFCANWKIARLPMASSRLVREAWAVAQSQGRGYRSDLHGRNMDGDPRDAQVLGTQSER